MGTRSYSDLDFRESYLKSNEQFVVEWPDRVYITFLSNQTGRSGDFLFEYKYINKNPQVIEDALMAEAARMANPTSSTVIVMGSALGGMMCVLICLISVVLALKYKKSRLFQDADDFELSRLQLKRTIQQQLEPNAFPLVPLPIADEDGTLSIDFQSDLCREKGIDEDC